MSLFGRSRRHRTSSMTAFTKSKLENPKLSDFELLKMLGKGSFSKVFLVRTVVGKNVFAMKVLSKIETIKRQQVEHSFSEFQVLRDSEHPFICQLFYAFETEDKLFLVSEFCGGGELYFYLQTKRFAFSSKSVKFYVSEIILALEYLHNRGVIHRDLKPENVMFDDVGHVRLIDFGLCKENVVGAADARTFCGTPEYMAPEMLYSKLEGRGHGKSVDFWGLGVLMYELLYGWPPFFDKNKKVMIDNILEKDIEFPKIKREVSFEAIDMITQLVVKSPEKRLGIAGNGILDLKSHPFVVLTNWNQVLRKKIKPPFKPKIKDVTENFDSKFTDADVKLSESDEKVDDLDNDIFDDFFYSRDAVIETKKNASAFVEVAAKFRSRKKTVKPPPGKPPALRGKEDAAESGQPDDDAIDLAHMQRFDEDESVVYPKAKVALEDFEVMKWLGKGSFSKVFLVRCQDKPKEVYAMKVFSKTELIEKHQVEHTNAEFSILRRIAHPFICALYHAFETETSIFLITEFCQGGELHYHVKRKGGFFDPEVKFLAAEIFLAVSFLHLKNVVYRDLKAENVMLDNKGHVRLIDFGCSKVKVYGFEDAKTFCGTPAYFAPEMILGKDSTEKGHGKPIDWWSMGILVYELYFGNTPFYDDNINNMYDNILKNDVKFPKEIFVPMEAQDLINEFLERNPKKRLGIVKPGVAKLIGHPFFSETDWELMSQRKVKPPFVPKLAGKTGHFDENITSKEARLSQYEDKPEHNAKFLEFSFSRE